jgi:hypothetical protein
MAAAGMTGMDIVMVCQSNGTVSTLSAQCAQCAAGLLQTIEVSADISCTASYMKRCTSFDKFAIFES